MLAACYGVDRLFQIGNVAFPASVACLVVLFLALLLSEQVLGEHRTRRLVGYIEVPVSFFTYLPIYLQSMQQKRDIDIDLYYLSGRLVSSLDQCLLHALFRLAASESTHWRGRGVQDDRGVW